MTWDDDRRMAAFISARDPVASGFARGVLAASRALYNPALDQDFQSAMLIYEALRSHGLGYAKDPSSALATGDTATVDSLQFPQQTLQYKSGDCDDLSILYCSLLESIGLETAYITTPGHVFAAFTPGVTLNDALKYLGRAEDFIVQNGRIWIPVETTLLSSNFLGAWKEGARQWIVAKEKAVLHPVHEAWTFFPPVVMPGTAVTPPLPSSSKLNSGLQADLTNLADREITIRAADLIAESKKSSAPAKILNALGVLYARYGQYGKALEQFNAIAAKGDYLPAMVNTGNIYLAQKQYKQAIAQFQKVLKLAPDNLPSLVGLALAQDGTGDRAAAKASYDKLAAADPALARQYAFLGAADSGGARAASAETPASLPWQDE
jgi:tetratricopeptide (TPR) repeat protein